MDPHAQIAPLTSIEVQLLSRSRPLRWSPGWGPDTGRYLHLDIANPREEHEAAAALVEKLLLEVTHTPPGGGTWYELTAQGLTRFTATWPHRKDTL